jgi:hypothetical protein
MDPGTSKFFSDVGLGWFLGWILRFLGSVLKVFRFLLGLRIFLVLPGLGWFFRFGSYWFFLGLDLGFDTGFLFGCFLSDWIGSFSFADTKMLKLAGVWKLFRLRSGFARRR